MCPISAPVNFYFSFWHYIPFNYWIDHSCQFQLPNPSTRHAAAHQKKFTSSWFKRKLLIAQILKRWLLVAKQVPYKFPNNIASKLLTLHAVNWWFVCQPKNSESSRSMQFYKYYFSENLIKLQNHIYIM